MIFRRLSHAENSGRTCPRKVYKARKGIKKGIYMEAKPITSDKVDLEAAIAAIPHWFHSIDLGRGVITPGDKSAALLQRQLAELRLPELKGKSVLDIGAWDGFYSFAAEAAGAARVVSLDHFVWALDRGTGRRAQSSLARRGVAATAVRRN